MEFTLDSENVQISIFNQQNQNIFQSNEFIQVNHFGLDRNENIQSNQFCESQVYTQFPLSENSKCHLMDSFENHCPYIVKYEIILKLEDYYLINNLKIIGDLPNFQISNIKFQNVNTGKWVDAFYFNPDNFKECKLKDNDSISIFSVGLTQLIKIQINTVFRDEMHSSKNLGNIDIHEKNLRSLNHSIEEKSNSNSMNLNEWNVQKKKNLNLNMDEVNTILGNYYDRGDITQEITEVNDREIPEDKQEGKFKNLNIGQRENIIDNHKNENYKKYDKYEKYILHIKGILFKIVVFSQYVYSLPNSTFLLTLLNLKNFFLNNLNIEKENISICNSNDNKNINSFTNEEHYVSSLFLTASSMIGARLFIQAWELFNKLQIYLINNIGEHNLNFFKIILEQNTIHNLHKVHNHLLLSNSSETNENSIKTRIPIFLTKLEIIKAVCMFEHGHTLAFLESLNNCINIYFFNDFSGIRLNISWTKINEIGSDKFYIHNFLIKNGKNLSEILTLLLKDQSEIIKYSSLKIIEFILDYNPSILSGKFSKIIKILLKSIYGEMLQLHEVQEKKNFLQNNIDISKIFKIFEINEIYFSPEIYQIFISISRKEKSEKSNKQINSIKNSNYPNCNNISPILIKQLNYTLDTLINNIDNISNEELKCISDKCSNLLFNLLKKVDLDSILTVNIHKLIRKLYENLNSTVLLSFLKNRDNKFTICSERNDKNGCYNYSTSPQELIINLVSLCINPNFINQFKEYFVNINSLETIYKKNSRHINSSLKQTLNLSNLLLESSEIGSLVNFIFEKISDDAYLFNEREHFIILLKWLIKNFEIINDSFEDIQKNSSKQIEEEFLIFYSYILMYICNYIFFSKTEIKSDVNKIFFHKIHQEIFSLMNSLIKNLINLEEKCLTSRKVLILFEPVIEILNKIKIIYMDTLKINFVKIFKPQYKSLLSFLENSGFFNINIYFLLKTFPLFDTNFEKDQEFIKILQQIFRIILKNFSNYYSEDMFELFSIMLMKLKDHLNEDLINEIITAIINKYNYKGNNFKICCDKFFAVILESQTLIGNDYFILVKKNIVNSLQKYIHLFGDKSGKSDSNIIKHKEFYLELIEKLELFKSYLEFMCNENKFQKIFDNEDGLFLSCSDNFKKIKSFIFSVNEVSEIFKIDKLDDSPSQHFESEVIYNLAKINDHTILAHLNEILSENYFLLLCIIRYLNEKNHLITKEVNNKYRSDLLSMFNNHFIFTCKYFEIINKTSSTYFLNENLRIMTKINTNFNSICEIMLSSNKDEGDGEQLVIYKIKFYKSLLDSFMGELYSKEKHLCLKNTSVELINFIETTILRVKEIYSTSQNKQNTIVEYFNFLVPILNFLFDSSDDFHQIFGIEIILKIFSINFDNQNSFKEMIDQEVRSLITQVNLPIIIWENVMKLTYHYNYKISLFAVFVIQMLSPREEMRKLIKGRMDTLKSIEDNIFLEKSEHDLIELIELDNMGENLFMEEEKLGKLHQFIQEKIIYDYKVKNTLEKNNMCTLQTNFNNENDHENEIMINKVDEMNDYIDLIKIPELNDDECQENYQNLDVDEMIKISQELGQKFYSQNLPMSKNLENLENKEELLSLEDLGVFEAEDEIFDNFDEDNIPVIKNMYRRKKGSAEKLKTNQNARNLLMSSHIKKEERRYHDYSDVDMNSYTNPINCNKNNLQSYNNQNQITQNIQQQTLNNESTTFKNNHQIQSHISQSNIKLSSNPKLAHIHISTPEPGYDKPQICIKDEENKNSMLCIDEDLLPDMPLKKKNIRPQNGLRPATPPLTVNNSNSKSTKKLSLIKNNENMPLQVETNRNLRNTKNIINTKNSDKKYEIRSMEELFLDDEEEKNENLNLNKPHNLQIKIKDDEDLNGLYELNNCSPQIHLNNINNLSHEDEILSSFENLNLEDFKNMSGSPQSPRSPHSHQSNRSINKSKKIIIQGVDYPTIDKINELLIKSQSQCEIKIEDYNDDLEVEKNLFSQNNHMKNDIHIEENPIDLDECLENNYQNRGELYIDDDENINMIQSISDSLSVSSENIKQLELIRENKSRRPPTRYGNREDQVLWRDNCQIIPVPVGQLNNPEQFDFNFDTLKKMNTISHNNSDGTSTFIKHLNINSVLKNKNKFKPLSSTGLRKMNRTFNLSSITERIHSPGSPTNRTLQNNQTSYRIPLNSLQQNLSNYEMNTTTNLGNISNISYGNKNIYNLHNLHNLSNIKSNMNTFRTITEMQNTCTQYDPLNTASTTKISSEFRKILKSKLNKNSDKIFANLKRLSNNTNNLSYNEQLVKNENFSKTVRDSDRPSREFTRNIIKENYSSGKITSSRAMSNPNLKKDNYREDNLNLNQDSNISFPRKQGNFNINTNLSESKYIVSSINKTPNFNYKNIMQEINQNSTK